MQSALGNADFIWILAIEVFVGIGAITDSQIGVDVLFISAGVIPQFGPMRTAERRAQEEGKVLADNAVPLLSSELESIKLKEGCKSNLFIDFFMPAIIIVGISIGTYIILGSTLCLEALVVASAYQVVCMLVRRMATLKEIVDTAIAGIKSVMSAILILPFCRPWLQVPTI